MVNKRNIKLVLQIFHNINKLEIDDPAPSYPELPSPFLIYPDGIQQSELIAKTPPPCYHEWFRDGVFLSALNRN